MEKERDMLFFPLIVDLCIIFAFYCGDFSLKERINIVSHEYKLFSLYACGVRMIVKRFSTIKF
jgi:hypothetical protein